VVGGTVVEVVEVVGVVEVMEVVEVVETLVEVEVVVEDSGVVVLVETGAIVTGVGEGAIKGAVVVLGICAPADFATFLPKLGLFGGGGKLVVA
jgi:hypothetical protein